MKESGMSNEWDDNINPTVSTGKHLGKPKGRADLGFFEDSNNEKNSARNICVLFIHYNFYGIKDRERDGDKEDVVTLEKSFYDDRNCHFRSLSSPRKDHLLQLLSDQDKLLSLFDLTADGGPSVLVLVFLSQGKEGEKILTDHRDVESNDFEHLTKKEVNDALEKLNKFKTSLPTLTIFCPCRGGSDEETIRSESCRITSTGMHNAAVPFSTFDSTSAPLDSTPIQQLREKTIENDAII
ncbi:uncharacterized protein LOC135943030 [Cloeon dipterum]|uniref:uncharacterized protein LOC135943030 n=1 Tax=Cloeon dipterum TaxID=197152 RepID=UPI00321FEF5E